MFLHLDQEMIKVREFKSKRLSFGNTLTANLLRIDDGLPKPSDRILPGPEDMLDISNVKAPKLNVKHHLILSDERYAKSTLLAQLHNMAVIMGDHYELDFLSVFVEVRTLHTPEVFS
ncbi:hypothetical protein RND71_008504 [Anisodus tanguticus]|uniref:Uncharacterized protein n=1 Tax=Anisodus tanguticus TaxID=243964 RepID=A0AAE1VUB9_9SOLA|nr:hypothetical protein RND71_008504 [Anisodus tanguticus]